MSFNSDSTLLNPSTHVNLHHKNEYKYIIHEPTNKYLAYVMDRTEKLVRKNYVFF